MKYARLLFALFVCSPPVLAQVANEQVAIFPSDPAFGDWHGVMCDINGDTLVASSSSASGSGPTGYAGSVYVYRKQADGGWLEEAKLFELGTTPFDVYGSSVAIDGDRILVGELGGGPQVDGVVHVYERQPNATWVKASSIQYPGPDFGWIVWFGFSVALDGDRALIGAVYDDSLLTAGRAHVFERQGDGTWTLQATLESADPEFGDEFGYDVDLDGDRAIVGAAFKDDGPNLKGQDRGAVYLFERSQAGAWS